MIPYYACLERALAGGWQRAAQSTGSSPASLTLSVADNGDGTGGMASIVGARASATVSLFLSPFSGGLGAAGSWTPSGQRTGNGTIGITAPPGHYFAYAVAAAADPPAVSAPVYVALTDNTQSPHYQCLLAAQARVQALSLPGLAAESVIWRKLPLDRLLGASQPTSLPCVLLTPVKESMDPAQGLSALDDVVYGVQCTIVAADNQEPTLQANFAQYTLWRWKIAMAFRLQSLTGVTVKVGGQPQPGIYNAYVEPAEVVLPAAWSANLYASALLLRFVSREPRGLY